MKQVSLQLFTPYKQSSAKFLITQKINEDNNAKTFAPSCYHIIFAENISVETFYLFTTKKKKKKEVINNLSLWQIKCFFFTV